MKVNNPILTVKQVRKYISDNVIFNVNGDKYNQCFFDFGWFEKRIYDSNKFLESLSIGELNQFFDKIKQIK